MYVVFCCAFGSSPASHEALSYRRCLAFGSPAVNTVIGFREFFSVAGERERGARRTGHSCHLNFCPDDKNLDP